MAQYLDYLRQGLGPNVGMFVGQSVLRLYVMGEAAQQREATDAEIAQMAEVLRGARRAGAFGLSYSYGHLDEKGNELPCHFADRREKRALMQVMAEEGRGMVEATPQLFRFEEGLRQVDEFGELALETKFAQLGLAYADTEGVARLLDHPGNHIGSADAGARITQFSGVGDTGYLFQKFVRERGAMSVERAVQRLTSDLARGWGITDRGEIASGKFADLVLFDPATIGRGEETWAQDVPGGSGRYVREAFGIERVIVNGQVLVENNRYTASRPGRIV